MNNSIDPIRYVRPPRLSVPSALSLGRILLTRVPEEPSPGILLGAQHLALTTDHLEDRWKAKKKFREVTNVRPYDQHVDRCWALIKSGLARYESLDPEDRDVQCAGEIHQRLFPTGLSFTQAPYIEQHAECQRRIDLIEEKGMRPDLERLVGSKFIVQMLEAHAAYGEVLGITQNGQVTPPSVSLHGPLRAVSRAVSGYALQVVAFSALDPAHVPAARHALEPIDRLRQNAARRAASRGQAGLDDDALELDDVEPDDESATPTPEAAVA